MKIYPQFLTSFIVSMLKWRLLIHFELTSVCGVRFFWLFGVAEVSPELEGSASWDSDRDCLESDRFGKYCQGPDLTFLLPLGEKGSAHFERFRPIRAPLLGIRDASSHPPGEEEPKHHLRGTVPLPVARGPKPALLGLDLSFPGPTGNLYPHYKQQLSQCFTPRTISRPPGHQRSPGLGTESQPRPPAARRYKANSATGRDVPACGVARDVICNDTRGTPSTRTLAGRSAPGAFAGPGTEAPSAWHAPNFRTPRRKAGVRRKVRACGHSGPGEPSYQPGRRGAALGARPLQGGQAGRAAPLPASRVRRLAALLLSLVSASAVLAGSPGLRSTSPANGYFFLSSLVPLFLSLV
ncbi:uncharacterized protein LOC101088722 [Felis catus]|uniref:uncharacterized protein LOC101088722 n=1 Tax=Felis catus TaxID=9685 RepID=UPI001D1A29B7|nr:uncharacterized protein LOC101088722 [Felis catus]XP_044905555.1 uncharacterized protein LOC101088722 [Felis catus]XP_044905556.1 uncharacterized protein LOC101088722 [Felis catus]XP_044905557.1 uncharacterized protein LOC101088722 [Felis catus]XP_044905558.1 uncharacterized protein LOC101088722 [Felis catus]XP_044905559.1 uncharacterized protein LOC101088722 [Felis catus]XP_044905561.1 uncharacterized protein LOC101088722 [Felis catus]XP_044905562.1 uncharacterized protein LOC101088722 [